MTVRGLNHLTLAVGDLDRSVQFYCGLLGFRLRARGPAGAYLEAGALWLCLAVDETATGERRSDYGHIAFDVGRDDFALLSERVSANADIWKENKSEGHSLYVLDPDGHKLELHVGSLESRLRHYREHPFPGLQVFD